MEGSHIEESLKIRYKVKANRVLERKAVVPDTATLQTMAEQPSAGPLRACKLERVVCATEATQIS